MASKKGAEYHLIHNVGKYIRVGAGQAGILSSYLYVMDTTNGDVFRCDPKEGGVWEL